MKWLLIIAVYTVPANAVDWDGPWGLGLTNLMDQQFMTEAACRNFAIQFIGKMHDGMLAPMRFRCVAIEASLPKGASR